MKSKSAQTSVGVVFALLVLALIMPLVWLLGSSNPSTPAGYVGYVTRGAIFGRKKFVSLQTGPTSPGRGWMLNAVNVSVTPYTRDEPFEGEMAVMAKDNLKIRFSVHTVFRINPDRVKLFVEQFSTLSQSGENPEKLVEVAYNNFLKEPLRTFARQAVEVYSGLEVKDNIQKIGEDLSNKVHDYVKDSPFDVSVVVVGNIQLPDEVSNSVAKKIAVTQDLLRQDTENQIEEKKKIRRRIESEGIAQAMDIINRQLTGAYLQYQAIEAQKMMVGSPNHSVIYIPVGPMGIPIVGNLDLEQGTAPKPTTSNVSDRLPPERRR